MNKNSIEMQLYLNAQNWHRNWNKAGRDTKKFTKDMTRNVGAVGKILREVRGEVAALGVTFGATKLIQNTASLDKALAKTRFTAGATKKQMAELRKELHTESFRTGAGVNNLLGGFDALLQSGLSFDEARGSIRAINDAQAVTGAGAETLAKGLTVVAEAFNFDLSRKGTAGELLDKLTQGGIEGAAELENIADIFARVGVNAARANLSFEQTVGLAERLSAVEKDPNRLATLVDSTLRLFTKGNYQKYVTKNTGIEFFGKSGAAKDPILVLHEIAKKYQNQNTASDKNRFLSTVFGRTDTETQKGIGALLADGSIEKLQQIVGRVKSAEGLIAGELDDALNNAIDQTERLKGLMGEAGDRFAQPVSKAVADIIQGAINSKKDGGLGLGAGELAGIAGLSVGGLLLGKKYGGKLLGKFSGGALGTAQGLATGKALESMAGVTPVYVVNMPSSGVTGGGGAVDNILKDVLNKNGSKKLGKWGGLGAGVKELLTKYAARAQLFSKFGGFGALGTTAARTAGRASPYAVAGYAGYRGGTWYYDNHLQGTDTADAIGRAIAKSLAVLGNEDAASSLQAEKKANVALKVEVEDKRTRITDVTFGGDMNIDVFHGLASLVE